ncbi:DUF4129 domain-containing protein [Roseibium sediminicola]|uniref:DUF4129 domain-containing protein n=1 Tax=Roseibium sediminicola TaxID=2933272 RepID=A0ABT0GU08_9HYPH|nr:DUF4129 domain-containing protein [Roseibium sp. CAU 1639]MCK7612325.1 DUF4129 domain-containing protein [Roseibium sp. CAU 1639]
MFFVLLILISPLPQAMAQEAVREPVEIGASGEDYLKSLRFRRIDTDAAYFDPTAPAPELKTDQQPTKPSADEGASGKRGEWSWDDASNTTRWTTGIIMALILGAIAYVFLRYGGSMAVSLKREAGNEGRNRPRGPVEAPAWATKTGSLEDILRMSDRRLALIQLMRKALAATVSANGILMQRSWTARDALRHLPASQSHLDRLRELVLASERVQFGGRDVTEDEFRGHLDGCRPLLGAGAR